MVLNTKWEDSKGKKDNHDEQKEICDNQEKKAT